MRKPMFSNKNNIIEVTKGWIIFVGPVFVIYTLFFAFPLLQGIFYSFTDWSGIERQVHFIGLRNYVDLFEKDPWFIKSLQRTFLFTIWNVILTNGLALLFAIFLTTKWKFNSLLRSAIFLPNMISMVVAGFLWLFMFTKMSPIMFKSTGWNVFETSWLGNSAVVMYSIVIVSLWHGVGYIMTIYIAALQGVDEYIVEAARIDGGNESQIFWKVKLPVLLPMLGVGAFINISGSLKIFDIIMSLTEGGPGRASEVAMINIYREAFVNNNMGYGAAKATVLSIIIIIIAIVQLKVTTKSEVQ